MKRLAMRRKIRETSEEALAVNPPLPNAEQPAQSAPTPPAASTPAERAFAAEALMPDIADLPEVPLESMWPTQPESGEQQPSAPGPPPAAPAPDQRPEPKTSSAPDHSADAVAPSNPADEQWQLPQWQYATKRGRLNQRRQRK
nr:hypothetical protein [Mycolicibacterium tusciae]